MKRMARSLELTLFAALCGVLVWAASWVFAPIKHYSAGPSPGAMSPENVKHMGLSIDEFVERFEGAEAVERSVERP